MKTLKNILTITIFILFFKSLNAQIIETRALAPFSKIEIKDNAKIILHNGATQLVKVDAENTEKVKTNVDDDKLIISGLSSAIEITIPELKSIEISGNGKITADSTVKTQNLRLIISGNGKITMPVDVSKLEVSIIGNGKLFLSGKCDNLDVDISGNGNVDAKSLVVNSCESNISGVGKNFVDVKNSLQLNISGSGSFYYKNKPANFETNITGIGKYGSFNESMTKDTTSMNIGSKKVIIIDNNGNDDDDYKHMKVDIENDTIMHHPAKAKSHWAGLEIGFNTLLVGKNFNSDMPSKYDYLSLNSGKSINVNINFFAHDFQLYKRYVLFTTGIGMSINNYRFTSDRTLREDTNIVTASVDYDKFNKVISYSKNKLAVSYVTVPLLLQFNTNQELKKSFHIAVGTLLSYKFNSHLKLVHSEDGNKQKSKRQDEFNIDPFRYDATVRIGYRDYTLYATYALSELFRSDRGPELHPFQFGINIAGW